MQIFIASLQQCIEMKSWPAAVSLALIFPQMAGAVESPELDKRQRYARWFDQWVGGKYRTSLLSGTRTFLSGPDCYALKCAVLYEDVEVRTAWPHTHTQVLDRYSFTSKLEDHCVHKGGVLQLAMSPFCQDVMTGGEAWLSATEHDPRKVARLRSRHGIIG